MKKVLTIILSLILNQATTVLADTINISGPWALALASVVAQHSPLLSRSERRVMARLFEGNTGFSFPSGKKLLIGAETVSCRVSNIDIATRDCNLEFKAKTRSATGREANEINATATAVGAPSDGAAGSSITSLSKLVCTIDPNQIKQVTGGGADCVFEVQVVNAKK
jgi:hypothetical protein